MAHDNYDKFYTWDKGTLILDPGVFAWDEPHVQVCDRAVPFANALDKIADPEMSKICDYPARLLSTKHSPAPAHVLDQCETVVPGRAYCCPPYVMPRNWRMDYLTMDYNPTSLGQEEEDMESGIFAAPQNGIFQDKSITDGIFDEASQAFVQVQEEVMNGNGIDADQYAAEAQAIAEEMLAHPDTVVETVTDEARAVYKLLDEEFQQVPVVAEQVVQEVAPVVEPTRTTVKKWPLTSVGLGIVAGLIVGKMLAR
jgi:ElaB/YqjD/DUF883 family membrane-anchored ribosome-binding protein